MLILAKGSDIKEASTCTSTHTKYTQIISQQYTIRHSQIKQTLHSIKTDHPCNVSTCPAVGHIDGSIDNNGTK